MDDFPPPILQGECDESAVTSPWNEFGTYNSGRRLGCDFLQFQQARGALRRLHPGFVASLPETPQLLPQPEVTYPRLLERSGEGILREVRVAAAAGERAYVADPGYALELEYLEKFFQGPGARPKGIYQ